MQSKRSGEAATLFKPRQVLLNSLSKMKHQIENGVQTKAPVSLSTQQRTLLLQSICQFLELNGFSKTLKNFRKEVDFEKESWKSCLLNLEEMCYHYLNLRNDAKVNDSAIEEQARKTDNTKENEVDEEKDPEAKTENHSVDVKKKKKKSKKASDLSEETIEENPVVVSVSVPSESEKKSKSKKKKRTDDSQEEKNDGITVKLDELQAEETSEKLDISQEEKKVKSKSKKKKEDTFEPAEVDTEIKSSELPAEEASEKLDVVSQEEKKLKSKSKKKNEDTVEPVAVDTEKKNSKKRKKSSSEENSTSCVKNVTVDDTKRRKTDNLDQSDGTAYPKTPNGSVNGVLEDDGNQDSPKGKKWQQNGSTEPRSAANAFRRVKEEEVEFVDEKLQDNSYWAKDGADSGYGAKAQEVLGQVRGRDFRHEKTKKKRGSYRGGQIDLHSHSFKFNYDDEE